MKTKILRRKNIITTFILFFIVTAIASVCFAFGGGISNVSAYDSCNVDMNNTSWSSYDLDGKYSYNQEFAENGAKYSQNYNNKYSGSNAQKTIKIKYQTVYGYNYSNTPLVQFYIKSDWAKGTGLISNHNGDKGILVTAYLYKNGSLIDTLSTRNLNPGNDVTFAKTLCEDATYNLKVQLTYIEGLSWNILAPVWRRGCVEYYSDDLRLYANKPEFSVRPNWDMYYTNKEVTLECINANSEGIYINDYPRYERKVTIGNAGTYTYQCKDNLGHASILRTFIIDKEPPKGTLIGESSGRVIKDGDVVNENVKFEWKNPSASEAKYRYEYYTNDVYGGNNSTGNNYDILSGAGARKVVLTDAAGNSVSYKFTIDRTKPTFESLPEYTNQSFTVKVIDSDFASLKIKHNGADVSTINVPTRTVDASNVDNAGKWEFEASDVAGNTATQTVNLYKREMFDNSTKIKNSFKIPEWYNVTLPGSRFENKAVEAGVYSFESLQAAKTFAYNSEYKVFVERQSENLWSYFSLADRNLKDNYNDHKKLEEAVKKWSNEYVSEKQIYSCGSNIYGKAMTEFGTQKDDDALTLQHLTVPLYLPQYKDLPVYLIDKNYVFNKNATGIDGNTTEIKIQRVSNGLSANKGSEITLNCDSSLQSQLKSNNALQQGHYLITESDRCGNVEQYLVFLQFGTPQVNALVTLGDGSVQNIVFDADYIERNKGTLRFLRLSFDSLIDNIDGIAFLEIDGRGLNNTRVKDISQIPVLEFDNGYYGKYNIKIYNRSKNALEFTIVIAAEQMYLTHTSLEADRDKCTFTINNDDYNNVLTDIKFYKVMADGSKTLKTTDDIGNTVNVNTMSYAVKTGGKYVFILKDIFGREFETTPKFFMKGLPQGRLIGVSDGRATRGDVSFEFGNDSTAELYRLDGQTWVKANELAPQDSNGKIITASIKASKDISAKYKFFLSKNSDVQLFTEYFFEIDCIPPTITVKSVKTDAEIANGEQTRDNFYVTWDELGATASIYDVTNDRRREYGKGDVISKTAQYEITVSDKQGNETIYSISLDNFLDWNFSNGSYVKIGDKYVTKNAGLKLVVNEPCKVFEVVASNGLQIKNGTSLNTMGTYVYTIEDIAGNRLKITVEYNNLPPAFEIITRDGEKLKDGIRTNKDFKVISPQENVNIQVEYISGGYKAYNGDYKTQEGKYEFWLKDELNKSSEFVIWLDKTVEYWVRETYSSGDTIKAVNGVYSTRAKKVWIASKNKEKIKSITCTTTNGTVIPATIDESGGIELTLSAEGIFNVFMQDEAGNEETFQVNIDNTPPAFDVIDCYGKNVQSVYDKSNEIYIWYTNKDFKVVCSETGSYMTYNKLNNQTEYLSEWIQDERWDEKFYRFEIFDVLGNKAIVRVKLLKSIQKYRVMSDGDILQSDNVYKTRSKFYCDGTRSNGVHIVSQMSTSDELLIFNGSEYISKEGTYTVRIGDYYGNEEVIILIIDKTPPIYKIVTSDGAELLADSKTNKAFKVSCDEPGTKIYYDCSKHYYKEYNGQELSEQDRYKFKVVDDVGNKIEFEIEIDKMLDINVDGAKKKIGNVYYTNDYFMLTSKKKLTNISCVMSDGLVYELKLNEKVTTDGVYNVSLTDEAGNMVEIILDINRTSPQCKIVNHDGKELQSGDKTSEGISLIDIPDGVTATYSYNGRGEYAYTELGRHCDGLGDLYDGLNCKIQFTLKDSYGNTTKYDIQIIREMKFTVSGDSIIKEEGSRYYSTKWLMLNCDYENIECVADKGNVFAKNTKIENEDKYTITLYDEYGNHCLVYLIIDRTPPTYIVVANDESIIAPNAKTSKEFQVITAEENIKMEVAFKALGGDSSSVYVTYKSEFLNKEGRYDFRLTDYLKNVSEFYVIISNSVDFTVEGCIEPKDNYYASKDYLILNVENLADIECTSSNGLTIENGVKVTDEGVYTLKITDNIGNVAVIILEIDKTPPQVELSGTQGNMQNGEKTNWSVKIKVDGKATLYDDKNNVLYTFSSESSVENHGKYIVRCVDEFGNETEIRFEIDKQVDVKGECTIKWDNRAQRVTTDRVEIEFLESVRKIIEKDGKPYEMSGNVFSEVGQYSVVAFDDVENSFSQDFVILPKISRIYERIRVPYHYSMNVIKDGVDITGEFEKYMDASPRNSLEFTVRNAIAAQKDIRLDKLGKYTVQFVHDTDAKYNYDLELEINNVPPQIELIRKGGKVTVKSNDSRKLTTVLKKDGKQVNYVLGNQIKDNGNYELVVTDEYGNEFKESFKISYINTGGIIAIVIGSLAVIGIVIALLISRFRIKAR